MTRKKQQSYYDFLRPNRQIEFAEYVAHLYKGDMIAVREHPRGSTQVRRYERRQ